MDGDSVARKATFYCYDKQLRRCPFCGGEALLAARVTWTNSTIAFVSCSRCTAQGKVFNVGRFEGDDDDFSDVGFGNAINAWQHRFDERGEQA